MSFRHNIICFVLLLVTNLVSNVWAQPLPAACGGSSVRYGTQGLPGSTFFWNVIGGTIIADYNDSIDVLWDNANVTGTVSYHEETTMGCISAEQIASVPVTAFNLDLEDNQGFCYGDSLELSVGTFDTIIWNGSIYSETLWVYDAGQVYVYADDLYGCSGVDSSYVEEFELPEVILMYDSIGWIVPLANEAFICGDEQLEMIAQTDWTVTYEWKNTENQTSVLSTDQNYIVRPGDYKVYYVTVTDIHTCQGSDTIEMLPCDANWISDQIPNAITPDGDHPTWNFDNVEFAIGDIKVFDRTGRLVWECDGYCSGEFDGHNQAGRELPMDSYFYIITLREGIGQITGTITVIR